MKRSESHTCKLPPSAGASLGKEHWNQLTCQEPIYANRHRPRVLTAPAAGVARPNILWVFFFQIKALKGKDHDSHHSSRCLPLAQYLSAAASSFAPSLSFFLLASVPLSLPPSLLPFLLPSLQVVLKRTQKRYPNIFVELNQSLGSRKAMTNLGSILESRDISLLTKVHTVKAMVFPVVMYGCESWTIKMVESQIIDAFELWCWRGAFESSLDSKAIKPVKPKGNQP